MHQALSVENDTNGIKYNIKKPNQLFIIFNTWYFQTLLYLGKQVFSSRLTKRKWFIGNAEICINE